jgi:hypothetical protein
MPQGEVRMRVSHAGGHAGLTPLEGRGHSLLRVRRLAFVSESHRAPASAGVAVRFEQGSVSGGGTDPATRRLFGNDIPT